MKKVNLLSRAEMRKVLGGNDPVIGEIGGEGTPGDPTGGGDDGGGGSGGGYRCCRNDNHNICSRCVPEAKSTWICVDWAFLTSTGC